MESADIKKFAMGACAVGLAMAGLYYLSRDAEPVDPKIHTKERMLNFLAELHLEN